jgi:predicted DNA-binding transcriptional regulator AlpA
MAKKITQPKVPNTAAQVTALPKVALDPAQVLRVREWIALSGLGDDYAWRLVRSGKGPRLLKLSERRYGIKVQDHIEWLERCAKEDVGSLWRVQGNNPRHRRHQRTSSG